MNTQSKPIILCVDDEKIILESLHSQLLRKFGSQFYIELAESAEEAQELIEEYIHRGEQIHAVISDWLMPGMKGDQLLYWIQKKSEGTKLILLTGFMDNEIVKEIACCNDRKIECIYKPWKEVELFYLIMNTNPVEE